jgi:release factor glutamine methyltransferase
MNAAPAQPLLVREALPESRRALRGDESALEAELLLMHALGVDRARLYQRLAEPLAPKASAAHRRLLDRRLAGEPLPYITGHREFFALDFETTPAALIPRPETETLVGLAIAFARERCAGRRIAIADIGTGSGIIAVALARELALARIVATDVSADALGLARRNAARHDVADRVDFREGDLLEPLAEPVQIIAANLPYVTASQWQDSTPEIRDHEPRVALDGGSDGLDIIRRLAASSVAAGGERRTVLRNRSLAGRRRAGAGSQGVPGRTNRNRPRPRRARPRALRLQLASDRFDLRVHLTLIDEEDVARAYPQDDRRQRARHEVWQRFHHVRDDGKRHRL